jgi:hypothetical protein
LLTLGKPCKGNLILADGNIQIPAVASGFTLILIRRNMLLTKLHESPKWVTVNTDVVTEALDSLRIGPENRTYPTEVVSIRIGAEFVVKFFVDVD